MERAADVRRNANAIAEGKGYRVPALKDFTMAWDCCVLFYIKRCEHCDTLAEMKKRRARAREHSSPDGVGGLSVVA